MSPHAATPHDRPGFATRAIHVGSAPDPVTGAVIPPIYQTSTFAMDAVGVTRAGYDYTRSGNPTRTSLADAVASLEGADFAVVTSSGMSAENAVLAALLRPGHRIVVPSGVYGGTYRLVAQTYAPWGVEFEAVDLTDLDAAARAIVPGTSIVWAETPTNPLLDVVDIAALADLAHAAGAILVVDNTFATPYLQQPLALGADVVVHSTTKYINGHSDVVGGAVVVADDITVPELADAAQRIDFYQNSTGIGMAPFDAWLTLRGLKTLPVRMNRHCDNAEHVAAWLAEQPEVTQVYYPGLADHPGHEVARRQMTRFGGMICFRVTDEAAALALVERTETIALAESLGGVESLIEHPAKMTHLSVAGSSVQVPADLVRLSVGLEDPEDLVADLAQALRAATPVLSS